MMTWLLLIILWISSSSIANGAVTPNFLIFMIDDVQFTKQWSNLIGSPGVDLADKIITYLDVDTPNINTFIEESIRFPRAYSNPKCSPSRFSLLTGRYVSRCQYGREVAIDRDEENIGMTVDVPTTKIYGDDAMYNVPNMLKSLSTYYTGIVGKWHLMAPDDYGCDTLIDTPNATLYDLCTDIVKGQGFDFVDAFYHGNLAPDPILFSHNPEWMVQKSLQFMDTAISNNQPFYLYFALTLTHHPSILDALVNYTSAQTPKGVLTGDEIPNDIGMKDRLEIYNESLQLKHDNGWDTEQLTIAAANLWVDDAFGALIDYLIDEGVYDDTFIVLLSDHGMGSKNTLYEQGSRFVNGIRYPPLFGDSGYRLPENFIVSIHDFAAVIFDLVNITDTLPDEYILDGKNWVDDVEEYIHDIDHGIEARDYDEYPPICCQERIISIENSHAIISSEYKYIFRSTLENHLRRTRTTYPDANDYQQLYDLLLDPNEQESLLDDNSTLIKDMVFECRMKMWHHIQNIVCLNDKVNITNCEVPNIDYVPDLLTWIPSTAIKKTTNNQITKL